MDLDIIYARAKRNCFEEIAGEHYCGSDSSLIQNLNVEKKGAILGIRCDVGLFTVITETGMFARNREGNGVRIPFKDFLSTLHQNGMNKGKTADFEFVDFGESGNIWVKNSATMTALWNISALVEQQVSRKT